MQSNNEQGQVAKIRGSCQKKLNDQPKKQRILLVDDEQDITSTFDMILQMNGFEVDTYNDPLLALSNFKPDLYGLALLDIRMPVMNGFELYKKKISTKI